jgi:two-component system response regulator FlrC
MGVQESALPPQIIPLPEGDVETGAPVVRDEGMLQLLQLVQSVARTPSTVLLIGESGVGKEVMARHIHANSSRANAPFIGVNCAALTQSLLESELFGHEKGSFTGAATRHLGVFERAQGGTILLDEISEISAETQGRLLRVLQERVMTRVGGTEEVKLDIRVIATTNRNLREWVDQGNFRLDLYYRLNVFPLHIPPLRQRRADIAPLILYHLSKLVRQLQSSARGISQAALARLEHHDYPGNVRELVNVLERAVILAHDSSWIDLEHLLLEPTLNAAPSTLTIISARSEEPRRLFPEPVDESMSDNARRVKLSLVPGNEPLTDVRRKVILGTLERFDGNRTKTAEALGVSLRTIRNKLREYRERGERIHLLDLEEDGEDER